MEALAAVGLASNVLSFVDFSANLLRVFNELRQNSASSDQRDYVTVAKHLKVLVEQIRSSARIAQSSPTASTEDKALLPVANGCYDLAEKLLEKIETCTQRPGQSGGFGARARTAIKCILKKRELEEIANRLQHFRTELALHMAQQIKEAQLQHLAAQPSKDDLAALGNRIQQLQSAVHTLGTNVEQKLETNQSKIAGTIAKLRLGDSHFQTKPDQKPTTNADLSTTLQDVLILFFNEYQRKLLANVHKEIRGTARAEMDNIQAMSLQVFHQMQAREDASQQKLEATIEVEEPQQSDDEDLFPQVTCIESTRSQLPVEHDAPKVGKNDITFLHSHHWRKKTPLGHVSVRVRRKAVFDDVRPPHSVYELVAHFTPSPQWLSTGCSVTYDSWTDSMGYPKLAIQPQTYRILDSNHQIYDTIRDGDINGVRSMLAQKFVSPSDRNEQGHTLLHWAAFYNQLEISKALIQSGADINAHDSSGLAQIVNATITWKIMEEDSGLEVFYYLQSLPAISLESFWENEQFAFVSAQSLEYFFHSDTTAEDLEPQTVNEKLSYWVAGCQAIEADLDVPQSRSFLEMTVDYFSVWERRAVSFETRAHTRFMEVNEDGPTKYLTLARLKLVFDFLLDLLSNEVSAGLDARIPVTFAAHRLVCLLDDSRNEGTVSRAPSGSLPAWYRGWFVDFGLATSLRFLEYVVASGISQRPDCVFDHWDGKSISAVFRAHAWSNIWEEILEEHGLDPVWVAEEEERRHRVTTGETSAHEVNISCGVLQVLLNVKRRKAYTGDGD